MSDKNFWQRIFEGELIQLPLKGKGLELLENARQVVHNCFQGGDDKTSLSEARSLIAGQDFKQLACACLDESGVELPGLLIDDVRLRAVVPGLEDVPEAKAVFHCHRDTWYGNPKCQVNAWVPLWEVDQRNSFRFFLDHFDRPIRNDSSGFSVEQFRDAGGFGRLEKTSLVYPNAMQKPSGPSRDIEMAPGNILFFSAAHLHQTLVNRTNSTRYSLDFRFFRAQHLEAGLGAPDPDNMSRGLMLGSYTTCD